MYRLRKPRGTNDPEPYQPDGEGAFISDEISDGTDVSEIDYPGEEDKSELGYDTDLEDQGRDDASSVQSEAPQYKDLESNLEEELDFAEINF